MGCVIKQRGKKQSAGKDFSFPERNNLELIIGSRGKKCKMYYENFPTTEISKAKY